MIKKTHASHRIYTLVLASTFIGASLLSSGQVLAEETKTFEEQLQEWEAAGIDVNHTEAIEKIRNYLAKNVEQGMFASLHIDRENPLGIIILSFTKEIPDSLKEELRGLAEKPSEVSFRVVKYTEDQLMEKQAEINEAVFEQDLFKKQDFNVYHTSTDIINNKVEVGISPFNEETTQVVYNQFGRDMIQVVEGYEVQTLLETGASAETEVTPIQSGVEAKPQEKGFFAKLWSWFAGLFK